MNTTHSNQSYSPLLNKMEPMFLYPLCAVYIVVILAAILGNVFVLCTIVATKKLRNSPTNLLIVSLSISDLLTAAITMPFEVEILLWNGRWSHGELMCNVWTTLYLIAVPTSILTLLAVSIDRYKTLSDPLNKYREDRFMTRKRAGLVVMVMWAYSIVFALIPQMGWNIAQESVSSGRCNFNITFIYSAISSIVNFILPLLITCVIYLKIYKLAKQGAIENGENRKSSLAQTTRASFSDQKILMKNLRAAKTISIIVSGFFLCWFPFTVFSLVGDFCMSCLKATPLSVSSLLLLLGYANSALNPYLYSFRNKKFRESSRKTLKRFSRRSHSSASHSSNKTPHGCSDVTAYDVHPNRTHMVSMNLQVLTVSLKSRKLCK